jgi:glutamyl-tRNA synthetase
VNFVSELWEQTKYFFAAPEEYDAKTVQKRWKPDSPQQLAELAILLETVEDFSPANTEQTVMQWIAGKGYGVGAVMNAFRLALAGAGSGPHIFDITAILGRHETVARIKRAIEKLRF